MFTKEEENTIIAAMREASVLESPMSQYAATPSKVDASKIQALKDEISRCIDLLDKADSRRWYVGLSASHNLTTRPFFDKLRDAGFLDGNEWKGNLFHAGVAAYYFSEIYQGTSKRGENGREYDDNFQYHKVFAKFVYRDKPMNSNTLKVYVSAYRDYSTAPSENVKYSLHEKEIKEIMEAFK